MVQGAYDSEDLIDSWTLTPEDYVRTPVRAETIGWPLPVRPCQAWSAIGPVVAIAWRN